MSFLKRQLLKVDAFRSIAPKLDVSEEVIEGLGFIVKIVLSIIY
jgi:hypothetical protein